MYLFILTSKTENFVLAF